MFKPRHGDAGDVGLNGLVGDRGDGAFLGWQSMEIWLGPVSAEDGGGGAFRGFLAFCSKMRNVPEVGINIRWQHPKKLLKLT